MDNNWEYNGTAYDLLKTWEGGGVLWTYADKRAADGVPLMTPRAMGQGYPIGPDRPFAEVINEAGGVREFGPTAGGVS